MRTIPNIKPLNGSIVADSGEGYNNKRDCQSAWSRFAHAISVQDYSTLEK